MTDKSQLPSNGQEEPAKGTPSEALPVRSQPIEVQPTSVGGDLAHRQEAYPTQSKPQNLAMRNHEEEAKSVSNKDGDTYQQTVTTHNAINISIGQSGLDIGADQGGTRQSADGVTHKLPQQKIEGHIPREVLEGSVAVPDTQNSLNVQIVDDTPVTTAFDDDGNLTKVDLPPGTPGTYQAVLALTAKGKPIYVPYDKRQPVEKGSSAVLIQVNQGVSVSQNVKVTKSPYAKGNFGGLFGEDDPEFWKKYATYLASKEAITDSFRPTRVFKSLTHDTGQSFRRSADAAGSLIDTVKNVYQKNKEILVNPIQQEFEDWRNDRIEEGETPEDFEQRMMTAPVVSWFMILAWLITMSIYIWQMSVSSSLLVQVAMSLWAVMITLATLTNMWRAHQATYRTFRSFGDWIKNPKWWISIPASDEQAMELKMAYEEEKKRKAEAQSLEEDQKKEPEEPTDTNSSQDVEQKPLEADPESQDEQDSRSEEDINNSESIQESKEDNVVRQEDEADKQEKEISKDETKSG